MRILIRSRLRFAFGLPLLLAGCASATLPMRYPSRPPAGMTAVQAEKDERACLDTAAHAELERAWAYIGCLVSRGHTVGIAFNVRTWRDLYFYVGQTQPHAPSVIAAELGECRRTAYAAARAEGVSEHEATATLTESAFRACLDPRGYVVHREIGNVPH